jgi:DNA-binding GntR family transcriptional regulator
VRRYGLLLATRNVIYPRSDPGGGNSGGGSLMVRRGSNELAEQVYLRLKAEIFDFRLLPGDRFTETELAERYRLSRTPVRDALYRLKREGYLDVAFRSGWSVKPFDFVRFDELYDLRTILECTAVERLCQGDGPLGLGSLEEIWLSALRETDPRRMAELDEAFHAALVEAAGNREIAAVHLQITEQIRVIRRLDFLHPHRINATYDEHARILKLVLRRRASDATMLLRAHIAGSKAEVRKITLHMMYEAREALTEPATTENAAPAVAG